MERAVVMTTCYRNSTSLQHFKFPRSSSSICANFCHQDTHSVASFRPVGFTGQKRLADLGCRRFDEIQCDRPLDSEPV